MINIDKRKIQLQNRLMEDYKYITSLGHQVLGVFVQGSDNYSLSWEGSDIDTKAIIIPSFEDFVLNKKPISTTLILPSDEHIDLKDIRLMHDCFRKQNINFIEVLFSKYKYINPGFSELYQPMFDNNEKIAHYNNYAAINCMAGMVYEKHKAMEHPYEGLKTIIKKYGMDSKQLHHMLRCEEFLTRYIDGTSYAECLISTNPQYLIEVKANRELYTLEEAREIANKCEANVKAVKQEYIDTHEVVIDHDVDKIMNNVLFNVLKYAFQKEIC